MVKLWALFHLFGLPFELHEEGNAFLQSAKFLAGAYNDTSQGIVFFVSFECLKTKMSEILGHF
jgi:hypothetical protein